MKYKKSESNLTPWTSSYSETLADSPVCVKLPVNIDTILRDKNDRSGWVRKAITFQLLMEESIQRQDGDDLSQVESRTFQRLANEANLGEDTIKSILEVFYFEVKQLRS